MASLLCLNCQILQGPRMRGGDCGLPMQDTLRCVHLYTEECSFSSMLACLPVVSLLPPSACQKSVDQTCEKCVWKQARKSLRGTVSALGKNFSACSQLATLTVFGPFLLPTSRGLRWADLYTVWISKMLLSLFDMCFKMQELSVLQFLL